MKRYKEYMNGVRASDTLRQRLRELKAPEKRPVPWKKYGAIAAALALVLGLGAWGLSRLPGEGFAQLAASFQPAAVPEIADEPAPDIAPVEPGDEVDQPGEKTLGGYEVITGSGCEQMVSYYILPYIEYGEVDAGMQVAADWDIPAGATRRDLNRDEIVALMGGEDAVNTHLDWGGYELSGWGAWYEDGSFWGAYIDGELGYYGGPSSQFELAVTAGQLPPTCFSYPNSVTQEIRGLTVTADRSDWEEHVFSWPTYCHERRVSFMKDGYGYRFEMFCGGSGEAAEELASRLVCRVAGKGLALWTVDPSVETYICPDCGQTFPTSDLRAHVHSFVGDDGSVSTSPYVSEDGMCEGYPVPEVCSICGESFPAGTAHDHELCGYPLAPAAHICEVCGQSLPDGVEHSHQEEHHEENHHGSHH